MAEAIKNSHFGVKNENKTKLQWVCSLSVHSQIET